MARLSKEQWAAARERWESDPDLSFEALGESLGVSAVAVFNQSKRHNWARGNVNVNAKVNVNNKNVNVNAGVNKKKTAHKTKEESKRVPDAELVPVADGPDKFGIFDQLSDKQEIFVREYMVDWNATQAAIRAGFSPETAGQISYQLLQKTSIRNAISALASERARRLGIDAEEMMKLWASIVSLDANEISQLRRVCCPFCWGEDHQRQYTPSGLEEAIKKHERERQKRLKADENDDIGEFPEYTDAWYDKRRDPHEDCPECNGDGVVDVFFNDTRKLSPAAKMLYAGVKVGKEGIEVLTLSKEKAMDNLARALGMFKEKEVEVNLNMVSSDDLLRLFDEKMRIARERQAAVLAERSILAVD